TAAVIGKNFHYDVSAGSSMIGLIVGQTSDATGSTDETAIFIELKNGLPQIALNPPSNAWEPFASKTLVGRIDLAMSWRDGKAQSKTVATLSGGADRTKLTLYSPGVNASFNGLLHESERFGVSVESAEQQSANAVIVLGDHSSIVGNDRKKLNSALLLFGL